MADNKHAKQNIYFYIQTTILHQYCASTIIQFYINSVHKINIILMTSSIKENFMYTLHVYI